MFYTLSHKDRVEQGDICYNLPKFLPSDLIYEEEATPTVWDNYIKSLQEKKTPKVKFSVLPSPTWGVILTQTCDIENAKEGSSILFAELNEFEDYHNFNDLESEKQRKKHINEIIKIIRREPAKLYFPELKLNNNEILGPWELDFKMIFFVPTDLIKNNKEIFWKARLINPGLEVLKEKISRFFTRLAFEECLFFSKSENEYYIEYKNKKKEEIMKIRRECGIND